MAMVGEVMADQEVAMHKRPVVYVSNLPYEARVEDLELIFEKEGISVVRGKIRVKALIKQYTTACLREH